MVIESEREREREREKDFHACYSNLSPSFLHQKEKKKNV